MRSEDLLNLIGNVDDKFVDELMNDNVVPMRRPVGSRHWFTIAACFAVIILFAAVLMGVGVDVDSAHMSLSGTVAEVPLAQNTLLMIDVNPGIQLEVNDRGTVLNAEATNADAEALMDELQLSGMNYVDAVKKTYTVMQEHEYITNLKNSLLVSVFNKDAESAESVRTAVIETIQQLDANTDYDLSILSQVLTDLTPYAELAESHGMSAGRAALIEKTCEAHEEFDAEALFNLSVHTINQLFEYLSLPELIDRIGTAAGTVPENCKEKLGLDGLTGSEIISFVRAISDFYDKLCEYYDMPDVAKRIGYEFDIACGQSEDGIKRWVVFAENLTDALKSRCAYFSAGENAISDWYSDTRDFIKFIDSIT